MTFDEIMKLSGVPVVLTLNEELLKLLLADMNDCEVVVQTNKEEVKKEEDEIVILIGIVREGKTVILLVSDRVTPEAIELYFEDNGFEKNSL